MRLSFVTDPDPQPIGRLVNDGPELRDGQVLMGFRIPSSSRGSRRVYHILIDMLTLETDCQCEWHRGKRGTRAGTALYGPVDLFRPVGLCRHLQAVSRYCRRHRKLFLESQQTLREVYEAPERRTA